MRTYDVTIATTQDMPIWPGDTPPTLELKDSIVAGGTANTSQITLSVHTGTHVDASHHFMNDGRTIEGLSMDILIGRAYVLNLPDVDLITRSGVGSGASTVDATTAQKPAIQIIGPRALRNSRPNLWASVRMGRHSWWIAMLS